MEMKQVRDFKNCAMSKLRAVEKFMCKGPGEYRNGKWTKGTGKWEEMGEHIEELL